MYRRNATKRKEVVAMTNVDKLKGVIKKKGSHPKKWLKKSELIKVQCIGNYRMVRGFYYQAG